MDDDDEVNDCAPTWVAELADGLAWTCDVQFGVSQTGHINLKEGRPLRSVTRRALARCVDGPRRHLTLSDSSVNVGARAKGRSPSPRLNALQADTAPEQLVLGLKLA